MTGRLIEHQPDAREELGLSSSGSDYCQGLTVFIGTYIIHRQPVLYSAKNVS